MSAAACGCTSAPGTAGGPESEAIGRTSSADSVLNSWLAPLPGSAVLASVYDLASQSVIVAGTYAEGPVAAGQGCSNYAGQSQPVPNATATGNTDFFIARISTAGGVSFNTWTNCFGAPNVSDTVTDLATNGYGDYYLAGTFGGTLTFAPGRATSSFGGLDYYLMKVQQNGNVAWGQSFGSTAQESMPMYITAYSDGTQSQTDYTYPARVFVSGSTNHGINLRNPSQTSFPGDNPNVMSSAAITPPNGSNNPFIVEYDEYGKVVQSRSIRANDYNQQSSDAIAGKIDYDPNGKRVAFLTNTTTQPANRQPFNTPGGPMPSFTHATVWLLDGSDLHWVSLYDWYTQFLPCKAVDVFWNQTTWQTVQLPYEVSLQTSSGNSTEFISPETLPHALWHYNPSTGETTNYGYYNPYPDAFKPVMQDSQCYVDPPSNFHDGLLAWPGYYSDIGEPYPTPYTHPFNPLIGALWLNEPGWSYSEWVGSDSSVTYASAHEAGITTGDYRVVQSATSLAFDRSSDPARAGKLYIGGQFSGAMSFPYQGTGLQGPSCGSCDGHTDRFLQLMDTNSGYLSNVWAGVEASKLSGYDAQMVSLITEPQTGKILVSGYDHSGGSGVIVLEDIEDVTNAMKLQKRWSFNNPAVAAVTTATIDPNGSYYVAGAVGSAGANFPTPVFPAPTTGASDGYLVDMSLPEFFIKGPVPIPPIPLPNPGLYNVASMAPKSMTMP
jgi:hypothetical protein